LFLFLIIVASSSFDVVPPGHTGVIVTAGRVAGYTVSEGFTFKIPFVQRIVKMDNRIQGMEFLTEIVTNDLQAVLMAYVVNYSLNPAMSADIFQNIGLGYQHIIIRPAVEETIKSITARYSIEVLIKDRARLSAEITAQLQYILGERGLKFERFNIADFQFSPEFTRAIERVRIAEQGALEAEQELERIRHEAQAQVVTATQAALARNQRTDAEAYEIRTLADAEAYKLDLLARTLTEDNLLALWIEQWDGVLPQFVGDGQGFMFQLPTN
jgi:regulator of protease activity HflC (stomatin/prohibitin superfamily)